MNNDRVMALMKHAAQMVNYNPATGSMVWRPRDVDVNGWNGRHAGKECGVIDGKGYRILSLRYFPGQQSMIKPIGLHGSLLLAFCLKVKLTTLTSANQTTGSKICATFRHH